MNFLKFVSSRDEREKFRRGQGSLMGLIKKAPTVGSCGQAQNFCSSSVNYVNCALIERLLVQKKKNRGFCSSPSDGFWKSSKSKALCGVGFDLALGNGHRNGEE